MKHRGALIGLSLFMVVALALTWLVYATLRRDVSGPTVPYAAVFSDVFGLREGDDVRMAGVRVGRVEKIELQGDLAKVSFVVESDQQLLGPTVASVTYQNIVGQRYLGLSLGNSGEPRVLKPGSVIPIERTDPSFDVGAMLNGYEPLFSVLNPHDADNLTKGVIQSLQGDDASIATLVDQTSRLTESFAGKDQALGNVITDLNVVVANLARHNDSLDQVITQTRDAVTTFDARRPELVSSMGSISQVVRQLSTVADVVYPDLNELVLRQPGFAQHLVGIEPQLAFTGDNLPLLLKGFARLTNEGAYASAYACDLNATGFFPGLNDVLPLIVDNATPGSRPGNRPGDDAMYTPRCRNMGNG
jgi:phospholipid/cholesterol/gamma-HCH transport system substrate-binding protein